MILLSLLILASALVVTVVGVGMDDRCLSTTPYRGCPAEGLARSIQTKQDNILKNRDCKANNVKRIKIEDMRDPAMNNSFYPNMEVEVTGYVARVPIGGLQETCNCLRKDLRDLQIEIVASPTEAEDRRKHVVLEISPRWEEKFGFDDSNYDVMLDNLKSQIEGKWVTFAGWMFYDSAHVDQSESTFAGNPKNWRATPWEIHPVTFYKVLPGPPAP